MHREKRLSKIKEILRDKEEISTKEIMSLFSISQDTARRDTIILEERGEARRTHGGLISVDYDHHVPTYTSRWAHFTKEKERIANAALHYIQPKDVYFFDVSTILLKMAQNLDQEVTVFTHSLDNAYVLNASKNVTVNLFGGTLGKENRFFYGWNTLEQISQMMFDTAFIAASGIDERGIYLVDQADAAVIQMVIKNSRKVILVAESKKWVNTSHYWAGPLSAVDVFITDFELTEEQKNYFEPATLIQTV